MACTGPPGCAVQFWEYSADRGSCIRSGSVFLGQRGPSTRNLGWRTGSGAAITCVSRRAGPQNDVDCVASPIRGVAGRDRDAEYSGFCTVQAGVRWHGKGCSRLFMHSTSEIMQDNQAACAGCPDWACHAPRCRPGRRPTGNRHEGRQNYRDIQVSLKYRLSKKKYRSSVIMIVPALDLSTIAPVKRNAEGYRVPRTWA